MAKMRGLIKNHYRSLPLLHQREFVIYVFMGFFIRGCMVIDRKESVEKERSQWYKLNASAVTI